MVARVEELVAIHVVDHLLVHGPLQDLAEYGQDSNRSVVFGIKLASFSFEQWHHLGYFPFGWKLLVLDSEVKNMADIGDFILPCQFQNISVKIINPRRFQIF